MDALPDLRYRLDEGHQPKHRGGGMQTEVGDTALVIKCSKCDSEIVIAATAAAECTGFEDQACVVCRAKIFADEVDEWEVIEAYKKFVGAAEGHPSKIFLRVEPRVP